jgi:hypothetical protein
MTTLKSRVSRTCAWARRVLRAGAHCCGRVYAFGERSSREARRSMAALHASLRLRAAAPGVRRLATAAAEEAPAKPLVSSGMIIGAVAVAYVASIGGRVMQARRGTLPEDLDGPLATLTAAKAIKKYCTPAPPGAAPVAAAESAGHSSPDSTAEPPPVELDGLPPAGSPEALELAAGLQSICDRLGRVQVETSSA